MTTALSLVRHVPLTMSSLAIAELVEARHDSVRRTIERLAERAVIQLPPMVEVPNHLGQRVSVYQLEKRDSYVVVAQLSPEFTARLVDRWQELEGQADQPTPAALNLRDPKQLAAVAVQLLEVNQELQAQIAAQAPKVAFAEAVGAAENDQSIAEVAKALGTGERRLFAFLRDCGVLMANNLPMQQHIDNGRFRVVERTWTDPEGVTHMRTQTRVRGKGVTFIQQLMERAKAQEPH